MTESLMDAMNAAEAAGEDTGVSTPTPAAEPAAPAEATPQTPETGTETPVDAGAADFLDDPKFDWNKLDPQLVPLAKNLHADYTRKRQAEAERVRQAEEQLRQFEGLDPGTAQWVRQVDGLARSNPALAAQMLEQEAKRLAGSTQAPTPAEAPFEALSDGERWAYEKIQRLEAMVAQQEQARARVEIDQQFAKLEREVGREISLAERQQVAQWCYQNGVANPEYAWKVLHWDDAKRLGRDEAAATMAQKAGLGPAPSGVAAREAPPGDRQPKTQREAIEMAYEAAANSAG